MKNLSAEQIINSFTGVKVLVIGDVMVDRYIRGSVERISPEAPVPVVRVKGKDFRLGGAANVGLNLRALGAIPYVCSVIGKDEGGEEVLVRFREKGLPAEGLIESSARMTTVKSRVMSGHHHVVRIDEEDDKELAKEECDQLKSIIEKLLPQCDVIIFEDYDKGVITPDLIQFVVEKAAELSIPTIVDPKRRNFYAYKGVTLFKPNLKELKEGLNRSIDKNNEEEIRQAVTETIQQLQCEGMLLTLSDAGVYIDLNEASHFIAAHYRDVADVSGAGDTVVSVAALCVAKGLPAHRIAALSNLAGGLVCEHLGVVPVDKDHFIKEASKLIK